MPAANSAAHHVSATAPTTGGIDDDAESAGAPGASHAEEPNQVCRWVLIDGGCHSFDNNHSRAACRECHPGEQCSWCFLVSGLTCIHSLHPSVPTLKQTTGAGGCGDGAAGPVHLPPDPAPCEKGCCTSFVGCVSMTSAGAFMAPPAASACCTCKGGCVLVILPCPVQPLNPVDGALMATINARIVSPISAGHPPAGAGHGAGAAAQGRSRAGVCHTPAAGVIFRADLFSAVAACLGSWELVFGTRLLQVG